ncbi:MAG: polyphosphate kinase 1 [Ferruginibacter sp.]
MDKRFLNRDISWLSFNGRVLQEATRPAVPLMERFRFLSIFSSNLDEFYRVRMPALMLLHEVKPAESEDHWILLQQARSVIQQQQETFGKTLAEMIPALQQYNIELLYNKALPEAAGPLLRGYFQDEVMAFLVLVNFSGTAVSFFAKSNALYQAVFCENEEGKEDVIIINVPSNKLARFFTVVLEGKQYIVFLDDIMKRFLSSLFPSHKIKSVWNIKITRDAELDLADEYEGDLADKIEKQLSKRDDGSATRFLYEAGMPAECLNKLLSLLKLSPENTVEGGRYHNLKDLGSLPVKADELNYPKRVALLPNVGKHDTVFSNMLIKDFVIHTPYQSYNSVLRFFNEAAVDEAVKEIYVTLYRVAGDSKIVNALITAAKNGKKVTVFIELKARFDEENNIRWSKRMKAAGVDIINSIPGLKVHAKVALVKRKDHSRMQYLGLVATGNLNEITARFYTDHILFTTHAGIVRELELLFLFLKKRRKPKAGNEISFEHLLVAQFNLQQQFMTMIDTEIRNAKEGKPSGITIKMNNLEEKVLINKLYEASQAGVKVQLIVRSICCLAPGVAGLSENISITRIVDRYLEHGRVFVFKNAGEEKIFIGSADWMNRNVYRRIEVCCPVYEEDVKAQIMKTIELQLNDNVQAVEINTALDNKPVQNNEAPVQSQNVIYNFLKN